LNQRIQAFPYQARLGYSVGQEGDGEEWRGDGELSIRFKVVMGFLLCV